VQLLGDRAQQHVALEVAVGVVVLLEVVDVDHQHRQRPALVVAAVPLALQAVLQRAPVRHAGERVLGGEFGELAVDLLQLVRALADARLELAVGLDVALRAPAHELLHQQRDYAEQAQAGRARAPTSSRTSAAGCGSGSWSARRRGRCACAPPPAAGNRPG
jgi:hypothetical protein